MQFIKHFLITVFVLTSLFLGIGWYIQPISGDLTRLGGLSERDWGWNQEQPVVEVLPNTTESKGPIIVIGDSFSEKNIWQSIVTQKTGWPIYTYHWLDIEPATCLESAIEDIRARFPEARTIILQSLERLLIDRFGSGFAESKFCKKHINSSVEPKMIGPTAARRDLIADLMPNPIYAIKALYHQLFAYNELTLYGDTYVAPLNRGDLFSNARSTYIAFYKRDLEKPAWSNEKVSDAVLQIQKLSEKLEKNNLSLVVMVVPDKLTVYQEFLKYSVFGSSVPNVWEILNKNSVKSVDLKKSFSMDAKIIKDLYLPDDTHVGQHGYKIIADAIENYLFGH